MEQSIIPAPCGGMNSWRIRVPQLPRCTSCRETYQVIRERLPIPIPVSDSTDDSDSTFSSHLMNALPLEVLVEIFSSLDLTTLLLVQRVCRQWQATISHTPSLQRALFFLPNLSPPMSGKSTGLDAEPSGSPQDTCAPTFFHGHSFNPLLACVFGAFFTAIPLSHSTTSATLSSSLPWGKTPEDHARVLRPEASWRRMLPSYGPPVRKLTILPRDRLEYWQRAVRFSRADAPKGCIREIEFGPSGMTMGAYYNIFIEGMSWSSHVWNQWSLLPGARFTGRRAGRTQWQSECPLARTFVGEVGWLETEPPDDEHVRDAEAVMLVYRWHIRKGAPLIHVRKSIWWCESAEGEEKPEVWDVGEVWRQKIWNNLAT